MAPTPAVSISADHQPAVAGDGHADAPRLRLFVMALFFMFGGITSLNDVIIPKLNELFTLSYTQAILVQFCFFTPYLVIGLPGVALVKRVRLQIQAPIPRQRVRTSPTTPRGGPSPEARSQRVKFRYSRQGPVRLPRRSRDSALCSRSCYDREGSGRHEGCRSPCR